MKELKEQIIEALQDAIDTETGQVSISYFDALLDNVLTEALRIHDVVGRSEQFYCKKKTCREADQCNHCWNIENPPGVIEQ